MTDKSYTIHLPIYDFHISKISFEALNILLYLKYTRLHAHKKKYAHTMKENEPLHKKQKANFKI